MAASGPEARTPLLIACTLGPADAAAQVGWWQELVEQAPPTVTRTAGRLVARFPAGEDVAQRVGRLADIERSCCPFVTWTVTSDPAGVELTVSGSAAGVDAVAHLWSKLSAFSELASGTS